MDITRYLWHKNMDSVEYFFHDGPNLAEIGDDCHIYGHIFRNVFKGSKPVAMYFCR